jgi:hypothetical protein
MYSKPISCERIKFAEEHCVECAILGRAEWVRGIAQLTSSAPACSASLWEAEQAGQFLPYHMRPGCRVVTSWTSHALPSGSLKAKNDP